MKAAFFGILTAGALAGAAHAQDWKVASVSDSMVAAVDIATIRRSGSVRTASTAIVQEEAQVGPTGEMYDYVVLRQKYDCAEERSALLAATYYRIGNEQSVHTYQAPYEEWSYITAGSVGGLMLRMVCSDRASDNNPDRVTSPHDFARLFRIVMEND